MSDLSRVEQLLRNALGEDIYEVTPQSRVEALLVELNELIEGMGGSVSPEDIATAVAAYLDEHPEATTTLQDGSVTEAKLNPAVKQNLLSDYYYDEITCWQERLHDTTCYFVRVPVRDSGNNIINPYLKYETSLTPLQHAIANHTTFTCNGTTGCLQGGSIVRGHVISRGQSVYNNTLTDVKDTFRYVSINADRTVADYPVNNTTQADMLENGAYNVFCAYYKLIENGIAVDNSETTDNEDRNVSTYFNPYYAFGVLEDNTLLFMAADGRTHIDKGLTSILASEIMLAKGCTDAWAMDGGGSVSYSVRGSKFNRNIDNNGMSDRLIHISLNFKKDSKSDAVTEAFGKIGEEKQNTVMQFIPYINDLYSRIDDNVEIPDNTDLNTITAVGRYAARGNASASTMTNSPTSVAFVLTIIKIASTITFHVICDYNGDIYVRRNYVYSNANHYTAWKKVQGPSGSDASVTSANIESALGYMPVSRSFVNDSLYRLISTGASHGDVLTYDSTVSESKPYPWSWATPNTNISMIPITAEDSAGIYYVISQLKTAADSTGLASMSIPFDAGAAFLSSISATYDFDKMPIISIMGTSPNPLTRYLMINNLWADSTGFSGAEMGYWDGLYHIEIVIGTSTLTIIVEKKG